MVRFGGLLAGVTAVTLIAGQVFAAHAQATPGHGQPATECEVSSGREPARAEPEQVGLDSARLADALAFAQSRNRLNIQVFRHNCLIGAGSENERTGDTPGTCGA